MVKEMDLTVACGGIHTKLPEDMHRLSQESKVKLQI
jgi:hypothetical protein